MKIYESTLVQAAREADVIDEVTEDLTYIGFFNLGDPTKCLIKKIEKTGNITTIMFPSGRVDFDQNWNERAVLNYLHKR